MNRPSIHSRLAGRLYFKLKSTYNIISMKRNNVIAILTSLIFLSHIGVSAQSLSPLNSHLQKVRIGLLDEFFERFNGEAIHPEIPVTSDDSRKKNLMALLDFAQFTSKEDSLFKEAYKMMDTVIRDSIRINFSDTTWVAIAHCKGTLEGKNVKFDLFLTVQHRRSDMYKWVINIADGELFSVAPKNDNERIMLDPDSHETNFISLRRATREQPHNIKRFISKSFDYDATSVFTYLVYSGKLKIDYVEDLEFVFTQIPEYIFHVKYFERETQNSGWLIYSFYKSTSGEKNKFLSNLHHQTPKDVTACGTVCIKEDEIVTDTANSEKNVDHRTMFIKRRAQHISQLLDNIRFMQRKDSLHASSSYQERTEALFADSTKVYLQFRKKSKNCIVDVPEFCQMLINGNMKFERVDSICIPLWDEKINTLPEKADSVELSSCVLPLKIAMGEVLTERPKSAKVLFAYKVNTELGIEWIPILGDLYVKVK